MSGPLWTGPLHDGDYIGQMLELAWEMGWTDLESLLRFQLLILVSKVKKVSK